MNKKVSIIIPTYNGEKYIRKTIDSCLEQTYKDVEIIVIDDYSSDNTVNILKEYGEKIKLYLNEQNQGISKNVNKGVKLSRGEYFILLGHDDMLRPNHIEIILNEFDEETSFVHCNADLIDKDDNIFGIGVDDNLQIRKTKNIKYYLALGNVVHSTGTIIRKNFFDNVEGWDESYRNYGEWLLWIKLASVGKVKYSTQVKALYRRHETNITNSFEDKNIKPELLEYYKVCQETAKNILKSKILKYFIWCQNKSKKIIKSMIIK